MTFPLHGISVRSWNLIFSFISHTNNSVIFHLRSTSPLTSITIHHELSKPLTSRSSKAPIKFLSVIVQKFQALIFMIVPITSNLFPYTLPLNDGLSVYCTLIVLGFPTSLFFILHCPLFSCCTQYFSDDHQHTVLPLCLSPLFGFACSHEQRRWNNFLLNPLLQRQKMTKLIEELMKIPVAVSDS